MHYNHRTFQLEQSTDYEERRVLRARLRQVMAEQEGNSKPVIKVIIDVNIKYFSQHAQSWWRERVRNRPRAVN